MLKDLLAGIVGIAIAVAIVFLSDELGHMLYPLPDGLDPNDADALRPYIATLPIGAFLLILGGWVVATFVGAVVAAQIGSAKDWVYPAVVGGFVFAGTAATLIAIPHPLWFSILALLGILASGWFAWRVAAIRSSSRTPAD